MLTMKLSKYWLSANHQEFELLSTYTQDDVVWARYRDILKDRQYHCHLEAFLQRFSPSVD